MNPAPETRLAFLDSLRGLAAAWVVFFHLIYIPSPRLQTPDWAWPWASIGGQGVTLFFMVSAFSLCYTMPLHRREAAPLRSFYGRRFFRIAPLFYAMLVFTLWRDLRMGWDPHSPASIAESVLFVFNLVPGEQSGFVWASWTIGAEMLFYLVFPLLYRWTNSVNRACVLYAVSVVIAVAFKLALDKIGAADFFTMSVLHHLPIFALGIAAFRLYEQFALFGARRRAWLTLLGAILLSQALAMIAAPLLGTTYYLQGPRYLLLMLLLAFVPVGLVVNRVTTYLGKLSYSLYLIHPALIFALVPAYRSIYAWDTPLSVRYIAVAVLTFGLLTALSALTYRMIEAPGMRFGKRLALAIPKLPRTALEPVEAEAREKV